MRFSRGDTGKIGERAGADKPAILGLETQQN